MQPSAYHATGKALALSASPSPPPQRHRHCHHRLGRLVTVAARALCDCIAIVAAALTVAAAQSVAAAALLLPPPPVHPVAAFAVAFLSPLPSRLRRLFAAAAQPTSRQRAGYVAAVRAKAETGWAAAAMGWAATVTAAAMKTGWLAAAMGS